MHKQFFRRITWVAAGVAIGAYIAVRRPGSSRWIAEITFACCNTPCGEAASRGDVDVRQTSIPRRVAEELVNRCLPSVELRNEIAEIVSSKLQVRGPRAGRGMGASLSRPRDAGGYDWLKGIVYFGG